MEGRKYTDNNAGKRRKKKKKKKKKSEMAPLNPGPLNERHDRSTTRFSTPPISILVVGVSQVLIAPFFLKEKNPARFMVAIMNVHFRWLSVL